MNSKRAAVYDHFGLNFVGYFVIGAFFAIQPNYSMITRRMHSFCYQLKHVDMKRDKGLKGENQEMKWKNW